MKVLFDTNVILDALLEREQFYEDAAALFRAIGKGKIEAFVSGTSIKDAYYIISKQISKERGLQAVQELLKIMQICNVDRKVLERAVELNFKDFEDAIQVAAAEPEDLDVIVTRDIKDFKGSPVPIVTPEILCIQIE